MKEYDHRQSIRSGGGCGGVEAEPQVAGRVNSVVERGDPIDWFGGSSGLGVEDVQYAAVYGVVGTAGGANPKGVGGEEEPLIDLDFSWGGISCSICVAAYVLHPKLLLFVLCTSQKKIKNL